MTAIHAYLTHSLLGLLAFVSAHPYLAAYIVLCVIVAVTPERYRRAKWFGWVLAGIDYLVPVTHPDSPGTLKLPGQSSGAAVLLDAGLRALDKEAQAVAAKERGKPGRVSLPHLAWSAMIAFAAMCITALLVLSHTGCAASAQQTERRAAAGTIAAQGVIAEGMVRANREIYTQATNTLGSRVQGADYAREVVPLDTVFDARSRALQALSADLYGSAALVNAIGSDEGIAGYAEAARVLFDAIRRDIAVLRDGTVLPAVPIPPAVDTILATLQGLAGAVH